MATQFRKSRVGNQNADDFHKLVFCLMIFIMFFCFPNFIKTYIYILLLLYIYTSFKSMKPVLELEDLRLPCDNQLWLVMASWRIPHCLFHDFLIQMPI